jgi:phosphate-selective porin OprO/OprP
VSQYKKQFGLLALLLATQSMPVWAQSADDKLQELQQKVDALDQRIRVAERTTELKEEEAANSAKAAASVSADTSGFKIKSNDGNFLLKIGADLQVDNRSFLGEGSEPLPETILLRRVRPTFSGTVYKYVDFFIRPDFGQGQTVLYEGYLELKYFSAANIRVGKFKPPVGLERLQVDDDTNFIERGFPTLLVPSRDIGYQISASLFKDRVNYAAGVFNGVPDNGLADSAASNHRDFAGRLFLTPFQGASGNPLSGLGFGIGASGGSVDKIALPSYKSFGQNTFVAFASGVTSAGHRTRLAPQGYYYLGPLGLLAEYTLAKEGFQKGGLRREIAFRAWQVQAAYILTGERKGFRAPTPGKSFDPKNHGWGAWELAVRVGGFSAEPGLFNYGFADPTKSPRRAREWVGGVSWYLNRLVRISANCGNTNFAGGAVNGNRASEKVVLLRFQVNFI